MNDTCRCTRPWVAAFAVGSVVGLPAVGGQPSDVLEPDVMRTESALQQRTGGLRDPLDEICAQPGARLMISDAIDIALCRNPATRASWGRGHAVVDAV